MTIRGRFLLAGFVALPLLLSAAEVSAQQFTLGATQSPRAVLQSAPEVEIYRDFLPEAVDLSNYMPPVGNQKQQGSCVGWASAYAARAYYAMQTDDRDNRVPQNIPSPAWVFNLIGIGDGCDGGAYIPDALAVLKAGAKSLAAYPYDDTKCPEPSATERSAATDFRIEDYKLVYSIDWDKPTEPLKPEALDQAKGELAKGNPVVSMAFVDDAFMDLTNAPGKQVWTSDISTTVLGGHAITLVGYDDAKQVFKFINSWDTVWGTDGYGFVSYDTFLSHFGEGWVMVMQGDPEITLAEADFRGANLLDVPVAPPNNDLPDFFKKLKGDDEDSPDVSRALGDAPIDFGELQCGAVQVTADLLGNPVATGFVSSEADYERVSALLTDEDNQIVVAPWPKCEVMQTLQGQLAETDTPRVLVRPEAPVVGDQLAIGIKTPGFASYLYAAYFSADGNVITLAQPSGDQLKPRAPHTALTFGTGEPGKFGIKVAPPVGEEMLLVVASEQPLFDTARPDSEADRQFLSGLRTAVLSGDNGRVTATLVPLTTSE
ncbi:MAG: C1 family peptidase [Devosia sp.]